MMMGKIIKCFPSIVNINEIDLCIVDIKLYFIYSKIYSKYFIHFYLIFYLNQKYINISKNVFCIKKLAVGQLITLNRRIIT